MGRRFLIFKKDILPMLVHTIIIAGLSTPLDICHLNGVKLVEAICPKCYNLSDESAF